MKNVGNCILGLTYLALAQSYCGATTARANATASSIEFMKVCLDPSSLSLHEAAALGEILQQNLRNFDFVDPVLCSHADSARKEVETFALRRLPLYRLPSLRILNFFPAIEVLHLMNVVGFKTLNCHDFPKLEILTWGHLLSMESGIFNVLKSTPLKDFLSVEHVDFVNCQDAAVTIHLGPNGSTMAELPRDMLRSFPKMKGLSLDLASVNWEELMKILQYFPELEELTLNLSEPDYGFAVLGQLDRIKAFDIFAVWPRPFRQEECPTEGVSQGMKTFCTDNPIVEKVRSAK